MNEQGVSGMRLLKTGTGVGLAALVLGAGGFILHNCQHEGGLGLNFGEDWTCNIFVPVTDLMKLPSPQR